MKASSRPRDGSPDGILGVVVESFSYLFQVADTVSLTREEMRSFKKVWTEFDPSRKGYLPRSKFAAFFSVRVRESISTRGLTNYDIAFVWGLRSAYVSARG
jgi:hypothetical protein